MKKILLLCFLASIIKVSAQKIEWTRTFNDYHYAYAIEQTKDNGCILVGTSEFSKKGFRKFRGKDDFWIAKLSNNGRLEWSKQYGGSRGDGAQAVMQANDGGYFVGGFTFSEDEDVKKWFGQMDIWAIKISKSGKLEWSETYGGSKYDHLSFLLQSNDQGFVVTGKSYSDDNNNRSFSSNGCWLVKLSANGTTDFATPVGGQLDDYNESVQQTTDGGFLTTSIQTHLYRICDPPYESDCYITKLAPTGDTSWVKNLNCFYKVGEAIQETSDGGYSIIGITAYPPTYMHNFNFTQFYFLWVKISANGEKEFEKYLGTAGTDYTSCMQATSDGGFILAGGFRTDKRDTVIMEGMENPWIRKLSASADTIWEKKLEKPDFNLVHTFVQAPDGDYIIARNKRLGKNSFSDSLLLEKISSTGEDVSSIKLCTKYFERYALAPTIDGGCIIFCNTNYTAKYFKKQTGVWVHKISFN